MKYLAQDPNSICVLRLSAIGDVCHAVAAIQALQRRWPEASITWIVGKVEASLLADLPGVELVVFDKNAGLKGYRELRQRLKGRRFDVLMHMQVALRASLASLCIKAKYRLGFDRKRAKEGQWLFTNRLIRPQKEPHVLEGFMGFAQSLGVTETEPRWQMPLDDSHRQWATEKLPRKQLPKGHHTLVIAPSASKAERNWTVAGYAALANYADLKGWNVVLCGGPAPHEKALAEEIQQQAQCEIHNLVGQSSLKQLLAVLEQADMVVAPDTGPAHMAVTVGTPVIGLYGHSNPGRTGPYLYQDYVVEVYHDHALQQHGKVTKLLKWGTRVKGDHVMQDISIDAVCKMFDRTRVEQKLLPPNA